MSIAPPPPEDDSNGQSDPNDTPSLDKINEIVKSSPEELRVTLNVILGILKSKPYLINEVQKRGRDGSLLNEADLRGAVSGPYYKEVYAKQIIPALDFMIAKNQDFKFPFVNFPQKRPGTVRARIYQSIAYVCRHLDPEGKYTLLYASMNICLEPKVGIFLRLNKNLVDQLPLLGEPVGLGERVGSDVVFWEKEMQEFIETADPGETGVQFVKTGLGLDTNEIQRLRATMDELSTAGIRHFVTHDTIKIIKLPIVAKREGDADSL